MESNKREEFYNTLKGRLEDTGTWPGEFMYKFIVPSKGTGVKDIEGIFDGFDANISTRTSSKGKFTSISILVVMPSADLIIEKFKQCEVIEGILQL